MKKPLIVVFHDLFGLYKFQKELYHQSIGEGVDRIRLYEDKQLNFETEVEVISNVLTININNRKMINYLHKKIIKEIGKSDYIIQAEKIKTDMKAFLDDVKRETLIQFSYDSDVDMEQFLKVFDVKFSDWTETPAELLNRYLELLKEVSKVKVVFIFFAWYLLDCEQINMLVEYCWLHNYYIIFIEKDKPNHDSLDNFEVLHLDWF